MKRILALTAAASIVAGCAGMHRSDKNPYDNPFYAKYFTTNSASDQQVRSLMAALQQNPDSAQLHNDLGQVLVARGFPKDAAREFERAIDVDKHYYPAWYNLGLVRASIDDDRGAYRAFRATIHYKPGHAPALFQMGLMEERRGNDGEAIDYYAKAFSHNRALLDIHVNPRVVDSKLVHLALLKLYPREHDRLSMQFHPSSNYMARPDASSQEGPAAPSTQPAAQDIVTPSAPTTDPSQQRSTPNAPAPVPATPPVPAIPAPTNSASVAP
ncbi:MAG: tetratricopeptide repeat protein, partial [Acidobacteria bacterium]|nr:tetratricopeptide repeat protein [Acidobacteriota bacterium]